MMVKKKILVTGSEGFIAKHLIELLIKKKFKIFGSYYKLKKLKKIKGINYIYCDITNILNVKKIIKILKPDCIFHLAAKSHPSYSFTNPINTIFTNVMGTINLLEACRLFSKNSKVIVACSSGQYGSRTLNKLPMIETDVYKPEHIYGLSKSFQDQLCHQYFKMYNLKTIGAIIFNTSGPGKKHDVFYDICSQFIRQKKKSVCSIKVGNINNYRDFMHVKDVANALYHLSQNGKSGENYNICNSNLIKVAKVVEILKVISKKKIKIFTSKKLLRKFDEKFISGSNKKIKKLKWHSNKNIKDIIVDTINYLNEK